MKWVDIYNDFRLGYTFFFPLTFVEKLTNPNVISSVSETKTIGCAPIIVQLLLVSVFVLIRKTGRFWQDKSEMPRRSSGLKYEALPISLPQIRMKAVFILKFS